MELPASLRGEYQRLSAERSPYLLRARDAARYTLPTLLPQEGSTGGGKLRHGYSNYGARCVNSLSSKLLLALLPARQAFFKLEVADELLDQVGGDDMRAEVDKALSKMEGKVQVEIETTPTRTPTGEAVKHLLVAGNTLVYMLPKGGLKVYALSRYCVLRDDEGNTLRIVTEDRVSPLTLPTAIRGQVMSKLASTRYGLEKTVVLYTGIFLMEDGSWKIWQEVEGIKVPDSDGTYAADASPWLALRWTPVAGESYGRSMVEDYMGYFVSLEALSAAITKGTAAAAKVLYLRAPNGTVKASNLTRSETGDVIDGKEGDVTVLQTNKAADFRTARETINDLKEELAYAFALNQAIQRNAERVTAEEIRYMATELDSLLGGIYSTLSLEFQLPFLRCLMLRLEKAGKLPQLPKKAIRPVIVTGLDALGRGAELENLLQFVKNVVDLGGPEALETYLNFDNLLTRLSTARGIKSEGLIKKIEEVKAAQAAKQQQQMIAQLGPNAVNQAGQMAQQHMAAQQPSK